MHAIKKRGTIYVVNFLQGGGLMKSIRVKIVGLILISVILCTFLITEVEWKVPRQLLTTILRRT